MNGKLEDNEFYHGLLCEVLVEGFPCKVTVETGSNITIINSALLSSLNIALNKIKPVRNSVKTVTGETVPLVGRGPLLITVVTKRLCMIFGLEILRKLQY
mgnify:CR=1 FL=1